MLNISIKNPFTKHPHEIGETYFQHMKTAMAVSAHLLFSSSAQLVHAVFPFVSPPLGTDIQSIISKLNLVFPEARANERNP